jgi:anaerobic selenocysteine-containing dehydrogenase
MTAEQERVVHAACPHDCPDTCAMLVTVRDGRAVRLVGDPEHPITRGFLCAKVSRYLDRVYSQERLLYPLRRSGSKGEGRFVRISWDEALDEIAERWRQIIAESGPQAILPYRYLGNQGMVAYWAGNRFFNLLGASQLNGTICGGGGIAGQVLSGVQGIDPEDAVHAKLILAWGVNLLSTNSHLWPLVQAARRNGARLVTVDPVRTRTAAHADEHVAIYPGTDGALALGLMHVILAEGLEDRAYVEDYTSGVDSLRKRAAEFPPERVAAICGVPAEQIVALARAYASARPALIRYGVGMMRSAGAGSSVRALAALAALCGHWRQRGGGLLGVHGSVFAVNGGAVMRPDLTQPGTRNLNMIALGSTLNDPDLAPPVRALYVYGSNPAVVAPDQERVIAGLRRDDLFTVVHDQFQTDTADYADIVLPATTQIEHSDAVWSWGHRYVTWNEQAIAPLGEARSSWDALRAIAARLGLEHPALAEEPEQIVAAAMDGPAWQADAAALRERGYLKAPLPELPHAEGKFGTPSERFEFLSERWKGLGLDPLPAYLPPVESPESDPERASRFPLRLVTGKTHAGLNSSYGSLPHFRNLEREPRLLLHPDDAAARGLRDGDAVRAFNDRGAFTMRLRVTDETKRGVAFAPAGWWAKLSPGGRGANAVTSMRTTDVGGGPTFCDVLVQVEASAAHNGLQ